jgi:acetolactate synthase-1/2/3 large subunit
MRLRVGLFDPVTGEFNFPKPPSIASPVWRHTSWSSWQLNNTVRLPDFVKLADAYGALAMRVTTPEATDAAINLALSTNDRTVVLDFVVSPAAMAWP